MQARRFRNGALVGDRYKLESPIGKGGMAEVWRANDLHDERLVAIKFLNPPDELLRHVDTQYQREELETVRKRFRREGSLLGKINHPGIPRLYDEGSHEGTPYLVMQYIDGTPLNDFLMRYRPLTLGPAVAIAMQIASALECAHERPVVHRDLKPQNVIVSVSGAAVLLDFGIARPLGADVTRYTQSGSSLGSPGYQAPEQIRGDSVVPKTDSYALGCVCYEMFTGRTPFIEEHGGLQGQHLDKPPLSLAVFAPQVPVELDELVLRMLAKSPDERPSMKQIQQVLRFQLPPPGSASPIPRLDPDPTLPYRTPAHESAEASPGGTDGAPKCRVEPSNWLKVRVIEKDCEEAEQELAVGDPGPAIAHLADIAIAARREWGSARPLVRKVWQLAAEGLRILGDCGRAAPLYQQMADDLANSQDLQDQATVLIWLLRVAECRLPFGDSDLALETLREATMAAKALPVQAADEVREVCQELKTDLNESGHSAEVQRLEDELG